MKEILLNKPECFHIIRETLERIGYIGRDDKFYPVSYILHKKGKYFLILEKELRKLNGERTIPVCVEERLLIDYIYTKLYDWELIDLREGDRFINRLDFEPPTVIPKSKKEEMDIVRFVDIA